MQVVRSEVSDALEACEDAVRRMRGFLPAMPPEELVMEFRLAAALVVGQLSPAFGGDARLEDTRQKT